MAFADELRDFSSRLELLRENIATEEATKTSMVMPFFQLLGYDIFNPLEFVPEFIADTGTKKGEKVDYAILKNGDPVMIVEVKPVNSFLNTKHINQLFRYFTVTKARFGVLTNGTIYRFFSDLEEPNKMDTTPFLEVDLLNLKADSIKELKKFQKECFNTKEIVSTASELKYILALKTAIAEQFKNPSDQFVKALIKDIYTGTKTQNVINQFKDLTLSAIDEYINDLLNEKLKGIVDPNKNPLQSSDNASVTLSFKPEELDSLEYIKQMLNVEDVEFRKVTNYAYIHIINSPSRWICRVAVRQDNKLLTLRKFDGLNFETEYIYEDPEVLNQIKYYLEEVYKRCKLN